MELACEDPNVHVARGVRVPFGFLVSLIEEFEKGTQKEAWENVY